MCRYPSLPLLHSRRHPWVSAMGGGGGVDCLGTRTTLLPHSCYRLRARPGDDGESCGLLDLDCFVLAAVSGPCPAMAGEGANCWTWTALLPHPRRCLRAWPGDGGRSCGLLDLEGSSHHPSPLTPHLHHHTPRCHCQTLGFSRERFSSPGGSRGAQPPNSEPCFTSPN